MGLLNTVAVLQAWTSENQLKGLPESKIGWIFSCYAFFLYFCGAQVGKLTSSTDGLSDLGAGPIFDAHNILFLILPGSVGIVAALVFLSLSTGMRHLPSSLLRKN